MARPENISNSKISGTTTPIALVATAELKTGETKLKVSEKPPTGLEAAGQFRIIIGSEILLVTGGQTTEEWTVTRNVGEGSKEANHAVGAPIYHALTKEAIEEILAQYVTTNTEQTVSGRKILEAGPTLKGTTPTPAEVSTSPGTIGTNNLELTASKGGNTSIATTGEGGAGGAQTISSGSGGEAASAKTASLGGSGGGFTFQAGGGGK